jgi:glucose-6-phosphate isomerase
MLRTDNQSIVLDVNNLMADQIGHNYGISPDEIDSYRQQAALAQQAIQKNRGTGWLGWTELPYNQDEIVEDILETAEKIRERFDYFVVLGIGGSALGPIAVQQALNHLHYNQLPKEKRKGPKLFVEDNIDPERMAALLDVIDLKKTCFNVISKSGATAETMSQYLIVEDLLKKTVGSKWTEHIVATTDRETGNLIRLGLEHNLKLFYIPSTVGGRFSELTPVGLLSAAVCGIDIKQLLAGAKAMDQRCLSQQIWENPALLQAVIQHILMENGVNIHVMMPYADSLKFMSDWFCQLWAESLGKNVTRKGMAVNVGQTPMKALGVTDQHSQLQLYTEGPYDKVVTFLHVGEFRTETPIPSENKEYPVLEFLGGKSLNQLIEAEYLGTQYALLRSGRMSQTIHFPVVNAYTIGQFLYFFELVTAYVGELLDINAFNQPGVEESKIASYAVLGNTEEKYQKKQEEMMAAPKAKKQYLL